MIKIRKRFNTKLKFDDFPIGFFGLPGGIEQKGVIFSAGNGVFVQPGVLVGDIPACQPVDDPFIATEDGKNILVLFGLAFLKLWCISVRLIGAAGSSVFLPGVDGNIELGDLYFQAKAGEAIDRCPQFVLRWFINGPMGLYAHPGDGYTGIHQLFEQAVYPFPFLRPFRVIVIIEQLGLRIGGMCILEGCGNEFVAADTIPGGVAQELRAVIGDGFVHDIPGIDPALVAVDDGSDVVLQALQ